MKISVTGILALASALGLGSSPARAAFAVVPPAFASASGNSSFGFDGSFTFQQVYGASLLSGLPAGSTIDGFSIRLAAGQPANLVASFANFDVSIGKSNFAPGSLTSGVAANEGADTVLARSGALTIAANSLPSGGNPNAFGPLINFSTPYQYTGGDLLLTVSININAPNNLLADNAQGVAGVQERQDLGYNSATVGTNLNGSALIVQFDYVAPVTVPEPSSLALVGIAGLTGLGYARARRGRSA